MNDSEMSIEEGKERIKPMQYERIPRNQIFRIIAQDPAVRWKGHILTTNIEIPAEILSPGPTGNRAQIIDYDTSTRSLYEPLNYRSNSQGTVVDPFCNADDDRLLSDLKFHGQNVYAITMRILSRFEQALGRRVGWSFKGHQIKVIPHAFADSNAFYSKTDEALLFGYFPSSLSKSTIFSCLSHDIIAHETTHAIVDGLRERYTDPSSPDQAAFHEAFADIVALLSVFALPNMVETMLDLHWGKSSSKAKIRTDYNVDRVKASYLTPKALQDTALLGLAEEMGQEMSKVRGQPLRASLELRLPPDYLNQDEFKEPHRRGEILVAAVMSAFVNVWSARLSELHRDSKSFVSRSRVAEEGWKVADTLLTMCIRAIDYCPPVHLEFGDFLSAMLTADKEIRPNDTVYELRKHIRKSFLKFGIKPSSTNPSKIESGTWSSPNVNNKSQDFNYSRCHFESMQRDPEEVFLFIWENRKKLDLMEGVFTQVLSVRPSFRIGDDGFLLRETVAEYVQKLGLKANELHRYGIQKPNSIPGDTDIHLYGGGVLIFDEYGRVKYHIHNHLRRPDRQSGRLQYLADYGYFNEGSALRRSFSTIHRLRTINSGQTPREEWI